MIRMDKIPRTENYFCKIDSSYRPPFFDYIFLDFSDTDGLLNSCKSGLAIKKTNYIEVGVIGTRWQMAPQ